MKQGSLTAGAGGGGGTSLRLPISRDKIAAFCEKNGIRKFSLFGSVLSSLWWNPGERRERRGARLTRRMKEEYLVYFD